MPARCVANPLLLCLCLLACALLAACEHGGVGPPAPHYLLFHADAPRGNSVAVCSAYGCRHKSPFTFTRQDIAALAALMDAQRGDGAAGERRAIRKAIAWIEDRVGRATGTSGDRAGLDLAGAGDPGQMDCVDEATNTTSYLTVLAANGLLHHHAVLRPMAKDGLGRWTHYFAVIRETASGQRWAVDSFMHANGREPIIMEAEAWYVRT